MNQSAPPIAVTMGDPAGIGPEITVKAFAGARLAVPALVVGDAGLLRRTAQALGLALDINAIANPEAARPRPKTLDVISLTDLPDSLAVGQVSAQAGQAAYDYVAHAIRLALDRRVRAIATAPINKDAFKAAGIGYPGHTEMLGDLTGTPDVAMMLANDELRTVLVTVHVSLREAIRQITLERELKTIRLAQRALAGLGVAQPRIAVAGLNPHAGENGLFGDEETNVIRPAVQLAQQEGLNVSGPYPGDTIFMRARRGEFDVVVAQYHDQGLIPVKYLGLENGINVTIGLPFVRTSVDHGTAFDIAGRGVADPSSLLKSIELAARLSLTFRSWS
jgi:4-hydroxythreonine-4-phosphate dehydrogenase